MTPCHRARLVLRLWWSAGPGHCFHAATEIADRAYAELREAGLAGRTEREVARWIVRFLEESRAAPVEVPYRQNRAVIFDSDLFHTTAPLTFKPGYENRRINVTMLFGKRHG